MSLYLDPACSVTALTMPATPRGGVVEAWAQAARAGSSGTRVSDAVPERRREIALSFDEESSSARAYEEVDDVDSVISNDDAPTPTYVPLTMREGVDAPAVMLIDGYSDSGDLSEAEEPPRAAASVKSSGGPATKKHRRER
jgi:hypothetical protein